jgi:metal-dependent amidase/aminoacylase/carboxypeptidase family protein
MSFEQQLISWRRELHQYPETRCRRSTTARIRDWLESAGCGCCPTS